MTKKSRMFDVAAIGLCSLLAGGVLLNVKPNEKMRKHQKIFYGMVYAEQDKYSNIEEGHISTKKNSPQNYSELINQSKTQVEKAPEPEVKNIRQKPTLENYFLINIEDDLSPNYTQGSACQINGIIFHSTEGSGLGTLKWLKNKSSKASAHYLIMEDGLIYQLVRDKDIAWHAGEKANPSYLGIELAGYANKKRFEFTEAQYKNLALLSSFLMRKYDLRKENVVSHRWITENIGGTKHSDPDPNFNWDRFYQELEKYRNVRIEVNKIKEIK